MTVQWSNPPEVLQKKIEKYAALLETRTGQMLFDEAQEAETYMKEHRPWSDITGNARRGLRTEIATGRDVRGRFLKKGTFVLYFIHSVEYGKDLELRRGGRFAIIIPTVEVTAPKVARRLNGLGD